MTCLIVVAIVVNTNIQETQMRCFSYYSLLEQGDIFFLHWCVIFRAELSGTDLDPSLYSLGLGMKPVVVIVLTFLLYMLSSSAAASGNL